MVSLAAGSAAHTLGATENAGSRYRRQGPLNYWPLISRTRDNPKRSRLSPAVVFTGGLPSSFQVSMSDFEGSVNFSKILRLSSNTPPRLQISLGVLGDEVREFYTVKI